jgi:hypothetical protein
MSGPGADGRRPRSDGSSLPDPALFMPRESPHAHAVRRIVLYSAALVGVLAVSAFALRGVLERVTRARAAALPALEGLAGAPAAAPAPERPPASPEELAAMQKSWVDSESIAPREDRVDPRTGEHVGAFQGFGIQIDGAQGARVFVNGEEMGTSPLLTTVDCRPGDAVEIRAVRGPESARAATRCRKDVLVKLRLALHPGR